MTDKLQKQYDDARFRLAEYDSLPRHEVMALSMGEGPEGTPTLAVIVTASQGMIPFGKKLRVIFVEDE